MVEGTGFEAWGLDSMVSVVMRCHAGVCLMALERTLEWTIQIRLLGSLRPNVVGMATRHQVLLMVDFPCSST